MTLTANALHTCTHVRARCKWHTRLVVVAKLRAAPKRALYNCLRSCFRCIPVEVEVLGQAQRLCAAAVSVCALLQSKTTLRHSGCIITTLASSARHFCCALCCQFDGCISQALQQKGGLPSPIHRCTNEKVYLKCTQALQGRGGRRGLCRTPR